MSPQSKYVAKLGPSPTSVSVTTESATLSISTQNVAKLGPIPNKRECHNCNRIDLGVWLNMTTRHWHAPLAQSRPLCMDNVLESFENDLEVTCT